ncbi:hypothetical protein [Amycolatopsis saalfeldensis]|uniref:PE family protein n=1 Tax=Amycolatopsis saalfeldensis TaxID=394193 RepID=A0A1H8YPR4_9PSEU|nr:hypothetical protein [Amycolatopsis saalfeldensis]SEP54176.1 hypothetical protein SAMN04489732_13830 [Amycolatopsis saalfeldensis]
MTQPAPAPGNWLSDVGFHILGDQPGGGGGASGGSAAPASGQGFSLSRDEALSMLNQAKGIRDDLWNLLPTAEGLTHLKPPADEPASNSYNALLVGNGQKAGAFRYGLGHIQREHGYLVELIGRLEDALGLMHEGDEQAGIAVKQSASNDGGLAG